MHTKSYTQDPWSQTLSLLARLSSDSASALPKPDYRRDRKQRRALVGVLALPGAGARIRIVERPDPVTATIAWYDPTVCHYGDQTWRASVARSSGVCAVSGLAIRRGDAIYRPGSGRPSPRNCNAMILARFVEEPADALMPARLPAASPEQMNEAASAKPSRCAASEHHLSGRTRT
ncbi:DUF3331 domain-containing protein [Paraburkholderia saeva]|jgi:hypothetical protein|uniref:DUF3331 domain-containing protein n=1 Tax=Paraburkholderia saeva TaxID=2777537 RepID=A0A9N8X390_9BURK|nr:DUF3331 domain-containing protein [Paraburkholderia saeva]CAG4890122.1 hypothetical protein R70241_00933 [Paraburkholderia saeva]CAG4912218.1 hypothetical protein LMG31841_04146 [Paraburkholderia saeva]